MDAKELADIRKKLMYGVEHKDFLYIKMQINRIDTLLYHAVLQVLHQTENTDFKKFSLLEYTPTYATDRTVSQTMPSVVKTKQILVGFKYWYDRQRKSPILFVEIDEYLSQLKGE